jgi:hypothetical protein
MIRRFVCLTRIYFSNVRRGFLVAYILVLYTCLTCVSRTRRARSNPASPAMPLSDSKPAKIRRQLTIGKSTAKPIPLLRILIKSLYQGEFPFICLNFVVFGT